MIGNREVSRHDRSQFWAFYEDYRDKLPPGTRALIERIDCLNRTASVGFRRRNLSALLAKYFFDMQAVLQQTMAFLQPGGTMFLVVGNNRTTAGGQPVEIRTADHLLALAGDIGFQGADTVNMEMLVSRGIFRKNAIPSEQILRLNKP